MTTAAEVAEWMKAQLDQHGALYQDVAATGIAAEFGEPFAVVSMQSGNLVIDKAVLAAFNALTKVGTVWVRCDRYWRPRAPHDGPGRLQAY